MAVRKDLTGMRFGQLTVLEKSPERERGYVMWNCRCECGNEILVSTKQLNRGSVKSCGCVMRSDARRGNRAEDLTGKQFGYLTVLSRAENRGGRPSWLCRCTCGNEKVITAQNLKSGRSQSCGCRMHIKGRGMIDLTGRKFGRLTVLESTEERDTRGTVCWRCRCECGIETLVSGNDLLNGNCQSCGCLKRENQQKIREQLHRIDGTCLEILEKRKSRRDNKSGFRGVFLTPQGKYRVSIGFKGKRYSLGTYEEYDDAVRVRLEAEGMIHDGFVEAYHSWEKRAGAEPAWAEKNPFVFRVKKESGILTVEKNV